MKRDIVLVLTGGCMSGIFSAGVVTSLQKANIYPRIKAVYGRSAGAHSGAYFLSEQTPIGSKIYSEDLTNGRFIESKTIKMIVRAFRKIFNKKLAPVEVINLDHLIKVESTTKKINQKKIRESPIKFYIRRYNLNKGKAEYVNGKDNTLKLLKESSDVIPFYPKAVKEKDGRYCDGEMDIGLLIPDEEIINLAKNNPKLKIIYIVNRRLTRLTIIKDVITNLFWSFMLRIFSNKKIAGDKLPKLEQFQILKRFLIMKNVYALSPKRNISNLCDSKQELISLYEQGLKAGRRLLIKLKKEAK